MLFPLPFSTFDQVRDLGHSASLYCTGCHRKVTIDLNDPRLTGKTFAGRVHFTCGNVIQRWTASPPRVCGTLACVTIYPPPNRVVRPADHGIMYCGMACPRCSPDWGINQARRDDPLWAPLNDKRFTGYRCPTCGARLSMYWHGWETRPQGSRSAEARSLMVGPWPHPPGTLRALLTVLKDSNYVICRHCKCYAPLWAEREDLDRKYDPCPFRCTGCGDRAEIVLGVPDGFTLTAPPAKKHQPKTPDPVAAAQPGNAYGLTF